MSQLNDISLVAQVVVFKNTRAFDQLVKEYQSPIRRFFLNLTCGDSELSDEHCLFPELVKFLYVAVSYCL